MRGLHAPDFVVSENKKPLKPSRHSTSTPPPTSPMPKASAAAPPSASGVFSDYQPVPEDSTLNVLLLDTLNTPMSDQAYVRYQLQQYVKNAKSGTRVAIFGLTSHLILLQTWFRSRSPQSRRRASPHPTSRLRPARRRR